jgi:hypothetical protein
LPNAAPAETAFAKQEDGGICFLSITDLEEVKGNNKMQTVRFNRWGWTNEFVAGGSFPETLLLYAGAGQCDLCNGVLVGNVIIDYSATSDLLTVRYTLFEGFVLKQAHIHVDGEDNEDKVPLVDAKYTVAPGQFGCGTHKDDSCTVSPESTDYVFEATFTNVPATFYVIAHAEVAGSTFAFSSNKVDC